MPARLPPPRGVALIEVMVAMGILAFGLLAMWHMHVFGLSSTAAGRRHTVAMTLARELVEGLERLPFADPLLAETGAAGPLAPAPFGYLVAPGGALSSGAREWDDESPVPGVRPSSMREQGEGAGYARRWTVWGYGPAGGGAAAVKIVAVSVSWNDPPFPRPREVVLYTQVQNTGAIFQNLGASQ